VPHIRCTFSLPCQQTMRSNAWMTLEEFKFLDGLIPQFLTQQGVRVVGLWLAGTAAMFLTKFPSRSAKFDRDHLTTVCMLFVSCVIQQPSHSFHIETTDMGTTPGTLSHWGQGPKYPPGTCWIHWEYRQQVTPMCPVGKSWVY